LLVAVSWVRAIEGRERADIFILGVSSFRYEAAEPSLTHGAFEAVRFWARIFGVWDAL
jgi:hypothetical protein